ncbi:Uncharacterised protein [Mycobacteroides abscessus subsp. abscessus]|nr:hypothetical protein [Mycobacteroides abscessus]SID46265.1 Uncharacterised protein [Mycobacteroides abscessus subsp. abscessus]SIG27850.1 Uncharacterised protein [Mycobacteroides abscessus subsp. abscessus]SIN45069.1 Uncharacterised protein [Mycobacteroides abscessus subsp. abscessus]SKU08575.1 Uncharacterised protein [Mycobacteroides abscessus subsp. abscessus]
MAPNANGALVRRMFALFREGGVQERPDRLAVVSYVTWRRIGSTNDLTETDIRAVVATLEYWRLAGQIEYRCRRIAESMHKEMSA